MRRKALLVVVAVLLVAAGWSAGRTTRAQTRVADFEISIDAPGQVNVTCSRGCDWPSVAGERLPTMSFRCESERCRWMLNGYGRITVGFPRTSR
jgi:hypothetical protein